MKNWIWDFVHRIRPDLRSLFEIEQRIPTNLQSLLNKIDLNTEYTNPFAWSRGPKE